MPRRKSSRKTRKQRGAGGTANGIRSSNNVAGQGQVQQMFYPSGVYEPGYYPYGFYGNPPYYNLYYPPATPDNPYPPENIKTFGPGYGVPGEYPLIYFAGGFYAPANGYIPRSQYQAAAPAPAPAAPAAAEAAPAAEEFSMPNVSSPTNQANLIESVAKADKSRNAMKKIADKLREDGNKKAEKTKELAAIRKARVDEQYRKMMENIHKKNNQKR